MKLKLITIISAMSLVGFALAQSGAGDHTVGATKIVKGAIKGELVTPRYIDTRTFPVQINRTFTSGIKEHENPTPPMKWNLNVGSASSAHIGQMTLPGQSNVGSHFPGIGATGWYPPDPNVAAGPNYLVETVNSSIAFFDKAGNNTFLSDFTSFFGSTASVPNFEFDPKCLYDSLSGRFFVLADEENGSPEQSFVLIAVSQTSNPNGGWNVYEFNTKTNINGGAAWLDYPSLATSKDGVVVSGNLFGFSNGFNPAFYTINKAALIAGTPVSAYTLLETSGGGSPRLAINSEANQSNVYGVEMASNTYVPVVSINNPGGVPTETVTNVPIPYFQQANDAASVGGEYLATLSDRFLNVYQRNGHIVFAHSVNQALGSINGRSNARWYQMALNGWPASGNVSLLQAGQIDTGGVDEDFQPGINEDVNGNIGLTFTRSNPSVVADVMVATRKSTDPAGFTGTAQKVYGGTHVYDTNGPYNRFGDYFDVSLDPADGKTFWAIGMTSNSNGNWQTYITSFTAGDSLTVTNVLPTSVSLVDGSRLIGGVAALDAIDSASDTIVSSLQHGSSTQQGVLNQGTAQVNFVVSSPATVKSLHVLVTGIIPIDAKKLIYAYNYSTSAWDQVGASAGNTSTSIDLNLSQYTNYIDASGNVKVQVRAQRAGGRNTAYNMTLNQVVIGVGR